MTISSFLLRWAVMLIGPVLLVCAYQCRRSRRTRHDFWVLLVSGLVATFSLSASFLPGPMRALMPIRVNTYAFYAAGALMLVWAAFTRLGPVARLLYLLCGIAFLSPILILTSLAVSLHMHGA